MVGVDFHDALLFGNVLSHCLEEVAHLRRYLLALLYEADGGVYEAVGDLHVFDEASERVLELLDEAALFDLFGVFAVFFRTLRQVDVFGRRRYEVIFVEFARVVDPDFVDGVAEEQDADAALFEGFELRRVAEGALRLRIEYLRCHKPRHKSNKNCQ